MFLLSLSFSLCFFVCENVKKKFSFFCFFPSLRLDFFALIFTHRHFYSEMSKNSQQVCWLPRFVAFWHAKQSEMEEKTYISTFAVHITQ